MLCEDSLIKQHKPMQKCDFLDAYSSPKTWYFFKTSCPKRFFPPWGRGCFGIRKRISFNPSKAKALCDKEIGTNFFMALFKRTLLQWRNGGDGSAEYFFPTYCTFFCCCCSITLMHRNTIFTSEYSTVQPIRRKITGKKF